MKRLILLFLLLTAFTEIHAQKAETKTISVDSIEFASTRKKLNGIDAKPFEKLVFEANGGKLPYRLLAPINKKSNKKYPLVIALHNSSRLGTDNENQLEPLTRIWLQTATREKLPAFVLAPQFETRPTIYTKDDKLKVLTAVPQQNLQLLIQLIESLLKNPQVDTKRIYLIGYSMGGSTAQHLLSEKPDWFAAMISIAGVPDFSNLGNIKNKPIWLIHGKQDDENPFSGSEKLFELLKDNKNIRFTIYQNLNHHNINYPFLTGDELAKWLFKWKK